MAFTATLCMAWALGGSSRELPSGGAIGATAEAARNVLTTVCGICGARGLAGGGSSKLLSRSIDPCRALTATEYPAPGVNFSASSSSVAV